MKTDKEAAEDYAYNIVPNPSQYETRTTSSDKWEDARDSFLAGCKHKEESRWIQVSEDLPPSHYDVLTIDHDGKMMVDQMVWFGSTLDWKSTTPVAWTNLPTPPQTNK